MDTPVTARSGVDGSSGARGIQSLWPGLPLPMPKTFSHSNFPNVLLAEEGISGSGDYRH